MGQLNGGDRVEGGREEASIIMNITEIAFKCMVSNVSEYGSCQDPECQCFCSDLFHAHGFFYAI